ncbi:hypothetical protein FNF27_07160 [Cafeteria roenbergensis]|uniref:Borealin N-terminal domain-containing protein n=1 Tax=Cafeteria roenbergensis TaxID=33653 RepID=A0A5A8DWQ1_CAFRO|nr:hypothetical protein FNF27_07160 [Cafeteria roenbergensis]
MASRSKRRPAQGDGVRPVSEDPARSELVCKLSELNVEVDRRCDKVVADSEAAASELRSAFSMQMAKLPKRIRAMTMREFIEQCGGNVMQAAAAGRAGGGLPRPAGRPPLGGSTGANAGRGTATPGKSAARAPAQTPGGARLARPDEVFVSANGSPVMLAPAAGPGTVIRATIGKSRTAVPRIRPHVAKGGADAPPPATSAVQPETEEGGVIIDLATADGRALDLSKPDVAATLSGADKEAALARLLALQSQVASVLSKLNA